jgi:hypothetical protein
VSKRSPHQIAALLEPQGMESKSILQSLVETADFNAPLHFRNLALHALANICCHGTDNQVLEVFHRGGLGPLTQALGLTKYNLALLEAVLDAIKRILEVSTGHNEGPKCVQIFEEYEGREKLEVLLNYDHPETQEKAHTLWDLYQQDSELLDQCLGDSNDVLDENLAPNRDEDGCLSLSSPVKRLDFGSPNTNNSRSEQKNRPRNFGDFNRGLY